MFKISSTGQVQFCNSLKVWSGRFDGTRESSKNYIVFFIVITFKRSHRDPYKWRLLKTILLNQHLVATRFDGTCECFKITFWGNLKLGYCNHFYIIEN